MTLEQLQKAQDLIVELNKKTNDQHQQIMEIKDLLNDYATWLLEEVKRIRDENNG